MRYSEGPGSQGYGEQNMHQQSGKVITFDYLCYAFQLTGSLSALPRVSCGKPPDRVQEWMWTEAALDVVRSHHQDHWAFPTNFPRARVTC